MRKKLTVIHQSVWYPTILFLIYLTTISVYISINHLNLNLNTPWITNQWISIASLIYISLITEYDHQKFTFIVASIIIVIINFQTQTVLINLKFHQVLSYYVIYNFMFLITVLFYDSKQRFSKL